MPVVLFSIACKSVKLTLQFQWRVKQVLQYLQVSEDGLAMLVEWLRPVWLMSAGP
jgi:hypothetical protein